MISNCLDKKLKQEGQLNGMSSLKGICEGLPVDPLPRPRGRDESVPHAPVRTPDLSQEEQRVC